LIKVSETEKDEQSEMDMFFVMFWYTQIL